MNFSQVHKKLRDAGFEDSICVGRKDWFYSRGVRTTEYSIWSARYHRHFNDETLSGALEKALTYHKGKTQS